METKMEERREAGDPAESVPPKETYVPPALVFLGDVAELTRGSGGSVSDFPSKGSQHSSSLRFKKDVEYLEESERDEVARQLLSLRLARWEYIDPQAALGHRPLGIIIEDNPNIPAVTPSKASIDLYSYASMAIAAAQVQAKQIEALRAELEAIKRELEASKKR
jgi:hypothetical protein